MTIVERARVFATAAHSAVGQLRKYTNEPYWTHTREVADMVSALPGATDEMIAAAHLHDVVEDTGVTIETVREEFGVEVADLVSWLTDVSKPGMGNREFRKGIDRAHTAQASAEAQSIKCMDLCSNTRSIVQHDAKFARTYLAEKRQLLAVMTRAWPEALQQAHMTLLQAEAVLAERSGE
jgi:guanosine-3',5'-bis(diphosphate) 3'-pyrophosphohydrolase